MIRTKLVGMKKLMKYPDIASPIRCYPSEHGEKIILAAILMNTASIERIKRMALKHFNMDEETFQHEVNMLIENGWATDEPQIELPHKDRIIKTQLWLTERAQLEFKAKTSEEK